MSEEIVKEKKHVPGSTIAWAVIAIIAILAAVAGFVLYFVSQVPEDAAAKVDDTYITEADVTELINQYKAANSWTDDESYATGLLNNGLNVSSFRQNAINELALDTLVEQKAEELGLYPSDKKINNQYKSLKSSLSFNDDDIWEETLSDNGMTEELLKRQLTVTLCKTAIFAQEVPKYTSKGKKLSIKAGNKKNAKYDEDRWSNDCDAYLSNLLAAAKITYYPVPDDAAYNVDMNLADTSSSDDSSSSSDDSSSSSDDSSSSSDDSSSSSTSEDTSSTSK